MRRKAQAAMSPQSKRSAIYCRISKQDDPKTASLETQAESATAKARAEGYVVDPEDVIYERFTGAELWDRPLLTELRAQIKAGRYQAVYIHDLDRLSREPVHQMILAEEFVRHGCDLQSASDVLDGSPESQLIQFIKGYAAKLEREKIRERTMRARKSVTDHGQLLRQGKDAFGYDRDPDRRGYLVNPEMAKWVVQMFEWVGVEGLSANEVCRRLNDGGVPCPAVWAGRKFKDGREPKWGIFGVLHILRNPAYIGKSLGYKTRGTDEHRAGKLVRIKVDQDEWQELDHSLTPAIVTEDLFRAAAATLVMRDSCHTRNQHRPVLLRGLVVCAACGNKAAVWQSSDKHGTRKSYRYYQCGSYWNKRQGRGPTCSGKAIPAPWLEALVWEKVKYLIAHPEWVEAQIERISQGDSSRLLKDALAAAEAALTKEQRIEKKLYAAWVDETDDDDLAARLKLDHIASRDRARGLRDEIAQLRVKLEGTDSVALASLMREHCQGLFGETFDDAPFEKKRKACERLGIKVIGNGKDVRIEAVFCSSDLQSSLWNSKQQNAAIRYNMVPVLTLEL